MKTPPRFSGVPLKMLSLIAGRMGVQQVRQVRGMLDAASVQSNPLNFGALGWIDLGIVDLAENEASQGFV